jgi:ribosomal protein L17
MKKIFNKSILIKKNSQITIRREYNKPKLTDEIIKEEFSNENKPVYKLMKKIQKKYQIEPNQYTDIMKLYLKKEDYNSFFSLKYIMEKKNVDFTKEQKVLIIQGNISTKKSKIVQELVSKFGQNEKKRNELLILALFEQNSFDEIIYLFHQILNEKGKISTKSKIIIIATYILKKQLETGFFSNKKFKKR